MMKLRWKSLSQSQNRVRLLLFFKIIQILKQYLFSVTCSMCDMIFYAQHQLDSHLVSYHRMKATGPHMVRLCTKRLSCGHYLKHILRPIQTSFYVHISVLRVTATLSHLLLLPVNSTTR